MNYPYRWSINLGINPLQWAWIKIWIGDRFWLWEMVAPLRIHRGNFGGAS